MKSLDSAGGVHVGEEDQAARLRRLKDAREDRGRSQEVRLGSNTGGVHHTSFRLYRSGVPTATCGVNAVGCITQRVRAERNQKVKADSGRSVTTSSLSWTRTSSHRPALEVEWGLQRDEKLPQSQKPFSTLRPQSTGIRALSIETSEGQDKIRGLKRQTSKRSVSSWRCDNTSRHHLG